MNLRLFRLGLASIVLAAFAVSALPAAAAQFVQDGAGMFSASTVAQLDERLSAINGQTGKEIVVLTVPSLNGATLQSAADSAFSQQGVNGVLIFIAHNDRRDMIVPDRAGVQAGWFSSGGLAQIRTAMESQFRAENYDAGIGGAVNSLLQIYRDHLGSLQQSRAGVAQTQPASQGVHIPMFWWIIILVVGFLLVRSIMRAASVQRYYGGPPATGGAPPAGPGYGAGYGPGYGYGGFGGGGSFWSGLLGGLGGAWLGNELFRGGGIGGGSGIMPAQGADTPADAGGWQSDAGQAGTGSGGDWSGGGFGSDFGGGGDIGGGGGDSGGGW